MSQPDFHTEPDPRRQAIHLLEFDRVCEKLAQYVSFPPSRELALSLTPSFSADQVTQLQTQTSEARRFLEQGSALELSDSCDPGTLPARADLGGVLRGRELRQIGSMSKAVRLAKSALARHRDLTSLQAIARELPDLQMLERELDLAIGETGEVLDSANPVLRSLRNDMRQAHQRLSDALDRALRRLQRQGVLQEPLITERNGRMVLLVKVEMKGRLPGIIHDVSDSGATVFVEPLSTVSLGNDWRELRLAVEREEERVLVDLSQLVGALANELALAVKLLARLDLAMAKARYSQSLGAFPPTILEGERSYVRLVNVRHPLLTGHIVPVTISAGDSHPVLLITGPNAGGKTVALKALGVSVLMAQAGLHIPATEAMLSIFDGVFSDIGDQQSIERSLSTFTSHIQTLRRIMDRATPESLVLLDELGTSTDPEEGAALAKAVLSHFANKGVTLVATSHYRDVAAYVQEAANMLNGSVELDPNTLEPTYRLTVGLPGRSYALAIAAQHGMDSTVVDHAGQLLAPAQQGSERLLRELQEERHLVGELRRQSEEAQAEAREKAALLDHELTGIENRKAEMLEEAHSQLQEKAEVLLKQLQRAGRALSQPRRTAFVSEPMAVPSQPQVQSEAEQAEPVPTMSEAVQDVAQVQKALESTQWMPAFQGREEWLSQLKPGDRVYLRGIPQPVEVIAPPENAILEVLLGTMRAKLPVRQVERQAQSYEMAAQHGVYMVPPRPRLVTSEVDLRGQRVEEALDRLEGLLNDAALAQTRTLRIIHGVGSGALRAAIRDHLSHHPLVKAFHRDEATAADGATVVELN